MIDKKRGGNAEEKWREIFKTGKGVNIEGGELMSILEFSNLRCPGGKKRQTMKERGKGNVQGEEGGGK